jgi:hypothetical protein
MTATLPQNTYSRRSPALLIAAALALAAILLSFAPAPADAAKRKNCLRNGATLEAASKGVAVVRVKLEPSMGRTRHENLLACWTKTGKRTKMVEEIDHGLDNIARTTVEIVDNRYVGVIAHNEGGISESRVARVYDAKRGKVLHTSEECEKVDQVDFNGVTDVAFLSGGGMAMACRQLVLYRRAGSEAELIEPAGTWVTQLAVARYSHGFGARLFWTVQTESGDETKSIPL